MLQWGTGVITNYTSVRDMVPSNPFGLAGIPEFALWANRSTSFNVSQCQRLVSGPYALTEVVNVITFLTLLRGGNQQQIQALWGLSMVDAVTLSGYFNYLSTTFVQNTLNKVFNTGNATNPYLGSGGLFTTRYTPLVSCIIESLAYSLPPSSNRTVTQWLWGAEDPLLKLLGRNPVVSLQVNQTSEDQALGQANNSLIWTGKGDLDRAFNFITWRGAYYLPAGSPW